MFPGMTEEHAVFKSTFKLFVDEQVIPYARDNDIKEQIRPEIIRQMAQRGFLGSMISETYGGKPLDSITMGLLNEELGRGCSSVRSLLTVHGMAALAIERWGSNSLKEQWLRPMAAGKTIGAFGLTEPNVGSDAKSIETTAELQGDRYVLNGKKKWITMGQIANVFIIFARCEDKPTAFLVEADRPGFIKKPITGMMGARASLLAELEMNDCRIPRENLLGNVGGGLSFVALSSLDYGRYTIAWGCVGLGQACLDECIRYVRKRKQFGVPLRKHQLIQKMISEMVVDVKAARLLCCSAGWYKEAGDPDAIMGTWDAKYYASKMANRVTGKAVQIHGANGLNNAYPIERYYRDARMSEIIEGTSQMHEVLIAMNAFRN